MWQMSRRNIIRTWFLWMYLLLLDYLPCLFTTFIHNYHHKYFLTWYCEHVNAYMSQSHTFHFQRIISTVSILNELQSRKQLQHTTVQIIISAFLPAFYINDNIYVCRTTEITADCFNQFHSIKSNHHRRLYVVCVWVFMSSFRLLLLLFCFIRGKNFFLLPVILCSIIT